MHSQPNQDYAIVYATPFTYDASCCAIASHSAPLCTSFDIFRMSCGYGSSERYSEFAYLTYEIVAPPACPITIQMPEPLGHQPP